MVLKKIEALDEKIDQLNEQINELSTTEDYASRLDESIIFYFFSFLAVLYYVGFFVLLPYNLHEDFVLMYLFIPALVSFVVIILGFLIVEELDIEVKEKSNDFIFMSFLSLFSVCVLINITGISSLYDKKNLNLIHIYKCKKRNTNIKSNLNKLNKEVKSLRDEKESLIMKNINNPSFLKSIKNHPDLRADIIKRIRIEFNDDYILDYHLNKNIHLNITNE